MSAPRSVGCPADGGAASSSRGDQQHLVTTLARWHGPIDAVAVEDRADPVAAAGQQEREGGRQLEQDRVFGPVGGTEPHRRRPVQQQPGGELTILGVLPHERHVSARRDVPVDVPQVVAGLVLPQVAEVDPGATEDGPVVPPAAARPAVAPPTTPGGAATVRGAPTPAVGTMPGPRWPGWGHRSRRYAALPDSPATAPQRGSARAGRRR
jgi:hypothetical protein